MAKRRRLEVTGPPGAPLEVKSSPRPPIAEVAGQSAALAAAEGLADELNAARRDGRLAVALPLQTIVAEHLVRDRMGAEDEEMAALKTSLARHGQRTPIEVVERGEGSYGLISGWRRLFALRSLHEEGAGPASVLAVIRAPEDAGAAYVAMVEENEIRVGLSYYERARIAALAAERGAFADASAAVEALYASGSKAKRSKIRSFLGVHDGLGDVLRYPAALPERLGLRIAGALKEGRASSLRAALAASDPQSAEAEAAALATALSGPRAPLPAAETLAPGIKMVRKGRRLTLEGPGVTDDLVARLRAALEG